MTTKIWGRHLSVDACGLDYDKIRDREHITAFSKELVEAIDMIAHGEPQLEYFAEFDPSKAGITLSQLIVTSNICCHFVDEPREAYLDIFSCKDFDVDVAHAVFKKYFAADDYASEFHIRTRRRPEMQVENYIDKMEEANGN